MLGNIVMLINDHIGAYAGLISLALVLMNFLLVTTLLHMRTQIRRHQQENDKQSQMSNVGVIGVGQRLVDLEKMVNRMGKAQAELNDNHVDLAYSRARMLLQQGLSDEAVVSSSGLSLAEVSLIKMIQQPNRQSAVA